MHTLRIVAIVRAVFLTMYKPRAARPQGQEEVIQMKFVADTTRLPPLRPSIQVTQPELVI